MATPVSYLISLTNSATVATMQATYPNGIQVPPNTAAAMFNIPGPGQNPNSNGSVQVFPIDATGWMDLTGSYGTETFTVTVTDQLSTPTGQGWPNPYPTTLSLFWVGYFIYQGQANTNPQVPARYQGTRFWTDGFEMPKLGDGQSGNGGPNFMRDASRTPDGLGFAMRNESNVLTKTYGSNIRTAWTRFYTRLRVLPSADHTIYYIQGSIEGTPALFIDVSSTGALVVKNVGNAGYPGTTMFTTSVLALNTWYRIDLRTHFSSAAGDPGVCTLYLNGVQAGTANATGSSGLNTIQNHSNANLGHGTGSAANGLEVDHDDWMGAAEVTVGAQTFPGFDLTTGSHVVLVRPTGYVSNAGWTGDYRNLLALGPESVSGGSMLGVTATTPPNTLTVSTDFAAKQWGCASISMGVFLQTSPGHSGSISIISSALGTFAQTLTLSGGAWNAQTALYTVASASQTDTLPTLGTITLSFTSASGFAGTTELIAMMAQAEMVGIFGTEDGGNVATSYPARAGIHNNPYPNLQANNTVVAPINAVRVSSGVYTGTGDGQDILSKVTANWWFVRNVTSLGNGGAFWFTGHFAAHNTLATQTSVFYQDRMIQALLNGGVPTMRLASNSPNSNQSTQIYQYIAISDIGMRFMMNAMFAHKSSLASAVNNLVDAGWTPEGAFLQWESYSGGSDSLYYKGLGHTSDNASLLSSGTPVASVATFAAGTVTSGGTIQQDTPGMAFNLWRRNDSSGIQWVDILSYTGNGAGGTRNIACNLGGGSPLFAVVVPHNAVAFFRDPSHSGATSENFSGGTTSSTAIVGGDINTVQVGTTLNANGIVYEVFVIRGQAVSGAWSGNGSYTVAAEAQRAQGPWQANPAQVVFNPVTINTNPQWRVHRIDARPVQEDQT